MNNIPTNNKNLSIDYELNQHMPKACQTMLKIEHLAQARLQQIIESIERGETTLETVMRERRLI